MLSTDRLINSKHQHPQRPFYYYTQLAAKLDNAPRGSLAETSSETMEMESLLGHIRHPTFIFLDNLDDYYEHEPDLWFSSMYGQFRAVREISLAHRNIQLFTSIRQDVYEQFADEMRLQYFDYVAILEYTREELLNIFTAHVRKLENDLLVHPQLRDSDPWQSFFGASVTVHNDLLDVSESVQNYICRHTLHRPRDIIHMGTVLLAKRLRDGFDERTICESVHTAQKDIAEQYLAEVRPLLDPRFNIKELVNDHFTSNVLSRERLDDIAETFETSQGRDELFDPEVPSDRSKPFATLYELGLLGYSGSQPGMRNAVQSFRLPGQGLSMPEDRTLPESRLYFLHPVLNHLLSQGRIDKTMLVGHGLSASS